MKALVAVVLILACAGCSGIKCTRTVRWMVDDEGHRSVVTEWQESYGWALKPPAGWQPEAAMTPPVVIEGGARELGTMPLLPYDGLPRF